MKNKFLGYLIAIIVCFCCICSFLGALTIFESNNILSTSTAVAFLPQPNFSTIIAQTASAAQSQTQTAAPPVIREPSSTPSLIPLLTDTPNPPNELITYAQLASLHTTNYVNALKDTGELLQLLGTDSSLLFDTNWRTKLVVSLAKLQITGDSLGSIPNPPSQFQKTDYWLKQTSIENDLLITNLTTGIDNMDLDSINRADANINNITVFFKNAISELNIIALTLTPSASISEGVCTCNTDTYNCDNFTFQSEAQQCFNYCVAQGLGDIHQLDDNKDNLACESLP